MPLSPFSPSNPVILLLLSGFMMPAGPLAAQALVPEARIQVRQCPPVAIPGVCLTSQGAFLSASKDSLRLRKASGTAVSVEWTPTTEVRVSRGRRNHLPGGAAIGLALGAGAGLIAGDSCVGGSEACGGGEVVPIFAGFGLVLGSLIGLVARSDRWVVVERPPPSGDPSLQALEQRLRARSTAPGFP